MKLTPLAKALLVLIGLGIIGVAVYRYAPPNLQFWRKGPAPPGASGAKPVTSAERPNAAPSTPASARDRSAPASKGTWIEIPGGRFPSGPEASQIDVPTFSIASHEVTNREYAQFLSHCAVGSDCGPRQLPPYWEDVGYLDTHGDHPVVFVSWGDASAYAR